VSGEPTVLGAKLLNGAPLERKVISTGKASLLVGYRRDGRAADCCGLENRRTGNCTEGSNPSPSAIHFVHVLAYRSCLYIAYIDSRWDAHRQKRLRIEFHLNFFLPVCLEAVGIEGLWHPYEPLSDDSTVPSQKGEPGT
jgi:hypothetical protein